MPKANEKIYFSSDLSERERACFETGIKLGALYHILSGIPIRKDDKIIESIERGIESAISCQPYVKSVKISFNREKISGNKDSEFDYDEITGKIINAEIHIEYESINIVAKVKWVDELDYPLMYIEKIHQKT
ncbi:MAG: dihydroneopterin aldolase family protein [Promethearchaeota archaeon]|nr:MAG: dihydroneopterin aldolase family protein [Candidatus Lokiarchaeota archaeon]